MMQRVQKYQHHFCIWGAKIVHNSLQMSIQAQIHLRNRFNKNGIQLQLKYMYVPVADKCTLKILLEFDYETHVVHTHSQYYIDVNSKQCTYMWQTCPTSQSTPSTVSICLAFLTLYNSHHRPQTNQFVIVVKNTTSDWNKLQHGFLSLHKRITLFKLINNQFAIVVKNTKSNIQLSLHDGLKGNQTKVQHGLGIQRKLIPRNSLTKLPFP